MVQIAQIKLKDDSYHITKKIVVVKDLDSWNAKHHVSSTDFTLYLQRENCPGCNGKGIAYAYFEIKDVKCNVCNGTGVIVKSKTIKKVIGVEIVENRSNCLICNGAGKKTEKVVNIALLYSLPADFPNKLIHVNASLDKSRRFITIIINEKNSAFYEKNEIRKFEFLKSK